MKKIKVFDYLLLISFLLLCLILISSIYLQTRENVSKCIGCNVILVTFDALGADHLGTYGYKKDVSPNLDAFADKSTVYTDSISQCGSTLCSLPSILTSRYPSEIFDEEDKLRENIPFLTYYLKKSNYSTFAVVGSRYAKRDYGLNRNFDLFEDDFDYYETSNTSASKAIKIIGNQNNKTPFFLWIHFREPHSPYLPRKEYFDQLYDGDGLNYYHFNDTEAFFSYYNNIENHSLYTIFGRNINLSETLISQLTALYDGNIKEADYSFGRVLDFLSQNGHLRNTIIIVAADHGENLGSNEIFDHNNLYYQTLHIPLIVYIPNKPSARIDYPVTNLDIFPTIINLLGLEQPENIAGRDIFKHRLLSRAQFSSYSTEYMSVKYNDYHLIKINNSFELYDVSKDKEEKSVLKNKKLIELLKLKMITYVYTDTEFDALSKLKSLGYIN